MTGLVPTLGSADYCSPDVFELERRHLFHRTWMLAARADTIGPGDRRVIDLAGESLLLTRDLDGTIHAHANVCRHRGARLCQSDVDSTQGSLMCPYHAWTYALDGRLIATPHLGTEEIDRDSLSLWRVHAQVWEGFVFVCLAAEPPSFDDWLHGHGAELHHLRRFGFGSLAVAVTTRATVHANWKIIVENYQECLHCTRVHPELVELVPTYRTGAVLDPLRPDGGVSLADGANSFSRDGTAELPLLPSMSARDASSYYGATVWPNGFVDVTGTSVVVTTLFPRSADSTDVVMQYLFSPETISAPGFDPSGVVEFSELVGAQDNAVCEMVQRGVASTFFAAGVLTSKDELVVGMTKRYRDAMRDAT